MSFKEWYDQVKIECEKENMSILHPMFAKILFDQGSTPLEVVAYLKTL